MNHTAPLIHSHLRQHGFNNPTSVTCLAPGKILVAEQGRYQLVQCHGSAYECRETVAGTGKQGPLTADFLDDEALADQARLFCPRAAVCGTAQIVYFSDANCVRRFVPATKEIRTIAGIPAKAHPAEGSATSTSAAAAATDSQRFNSPWGLAIDEDKGLLYVADSGNHCVKRITLLTGDVCVVVAQGSGLRYPVGLALHRDGEWLYCSDEGGIKCIELATGAVTVWAGYSCGLQDGPALSAKFNGPRGMTFDYSGNLYVADRGNSCIRKITPDGIVSTVLPGGIVTQPYDCDISHKGELVVSDAYQGVLHVFDLNLKRPDHIKVPLSTYTARMGDLLDSGAAADVIFQVCDEQIAAHKLILMTQCDYFRKMLAPDNFVEGQSGVVTANDTTPAAFRALLRYLYTDELSFPDDIILDVMLLAQKMLIHRVLNHCLLHVRHNLSPRNVVNWWMWADEHNGFGELRATAFSYLVSNFKDVRKNKDQLSLLIARRSDLVMDLLLRL